MHNSKSKLRKKSNTRIILFITILFAFSFYISGCSQEEPSQTYTTKILVLDNCDGNDNLENSQGDTVLMLDTNGELLHKIDGLKVKESFGGNKAISLSGDGQFFAVCENAGNKLTVFETSTGQEYWSTSWSDKYVDSVVYANDIMFATNPNLILTIEFNKQGTKDEEIIEEENYLLSESWLDYVFDKNNNSLWTVGLDIKKFILGTELTLQTRTNFEHMNSEAFSVDITSDGSAWVVIKEIGENNGNENSLLKVSPDGVIVETVNLNFGPNCICVDKSDDSVWVTGISYSQDYSMIGEEWPETLTELHEIIKIDIQTYTQRYNSQGNLLVNIDKGGYSIDIDPSDSSVWIAGHDSIIHCSSIGDIIAEYTNVSRQRKWVVVVK